MSRHYILMGDIIKSRHYDAGRLRPKFMQLISSCNDKFEREILSPYTVTLGDEFQGVARSLSAAIKTIFYLEETTLGRKLMFKLRYVVVHGEIETSVNRQNAHGMLGEGLTKAREILTDKRRSEQRFRFDLSDSSLMKQYNRLFQVVDGLNGRWKTKDSELIVDMLANTNNEEVGLKHDKNRTQIWKRRKQLLVEEYQALRDAIMDMGR